MDAPLVADKHSAHYRHAARAAHTPGGRAALVFNLDCADLIMTAEREVQALTEDMPRQLSRRLSHNDTQ